MNDKALNPFTAQEVAPTGTNALQESESQRAIQEVQAALIIAKQFPRDSMAAMDRILNACTRPSLAEKALYSYPRGGQEVTGPSIRLAEAMAQQWGNLQFGIRELSQQNGSSTVEAYAWDVETNTRQVKVFQVEHKRFTKKGTYALTDPRDIYELVANNGARRLRACILGIIPGDVTEAAVNQCDVTLSANVDTSPENIAKMLGVFERFAVTSELIEEKIGMRIEAIRPAQVLQLHKILISLNDGMSKPSDWFNMVDAAQLAKPKESSINEQLNQTTASTSAPKSEEVAPVDPQWPEYRDGAGWVDSQGDIYAERSHVWGDGQPIVNNDGTFRKRRAKKEPAADPKQTESPEPQQSGVAGEVIQPPFDYLMGLLEMCNTLDQIDQVLGSHWWSELDDDERKRLQLRIAAIRNDIDAGTRSE